MKAKREMVVERLKVKVFNNREEIAQAAGKAVASRIKELLLKQNKVTILFAAAPSQNEFLKVLAEEPEIDWSKIVALHMDEYIGLSPDSPQLFRKYLDDHIINLVHPGEVYYLEGNAKSLDDECQRYEKLLVDNPVDIVCCGIGENGHLAFNDPPVADFLDQEIVKVVELEETCRQQQVNDGCFPTLDDVPKKALTLTIPALFSGRYIYCIVPGSTKAKAVRNCIIEPVSVSCPASILRRHFRSILYLDSDSAAMI